MSILAIALQNPQEWLQNTLVWIDQLGIWGVIAFLLLYIIAAIAFLPGVILTLGGGVIFGFFPGILIVFLAATLGAIAAFCVGRYLARDWVAHKIEGNTTFQAIDRAVNREGFKIVLLTRLSPVFPFNLLNYALGLTSVSLKDYALGSIGMLPATALYVYIGSLAGNLATLGTSPPAANPTLLWGVRAIGLVATLVVSLVVTHIARKALAEQVEEG